jgi:FRG domain
MTILKEESISSYKDFIAFTEDHRARLDRPLWFRGCGKKIYELTPSLYRHRYTRNIEDFMKLEETLIQRFQQRSIPFNTREMRDSWEWLFLMQHYGIPTRLLDWTESPLTALFFAVTASPYKLNANQTYGFSSDAAVWILSPDDWNKKSVDLASFPGRILSTNDSNLNAYEPIGDCGVMKDFPLAIFGSHNSQRIVAQRGVFVVFGKDTNSMEKIYRNNDFPEDCLYKIILKKSDLPDLLDAIRRNGITDSVVFPDLDGLSREIRREFKFGV